MTGEPRDDTAAVDVGDFCRRVESHLTKVNGGHLVRVVGPGFDLVRRWAEDGVPLNIVLRGIERKADRHRLGSSTRPLRVEFCEDDVRQVYDEWRRAIGATAGVSVADDLSDEGKDAKRRQPSLAKHFERALGRLEQAAARPGWPADLREAFESCRARVVALQEESHGAKGAAREKVTSQLVALDEELLALARRHAPADLLQEVRREAEADLAPFRSRLSAEAWLASVDMTAARLLRDRLGLPALALPA